jgi:hypothetical protein
MDSELAPGRDLDVLVAERVFGLRIVADSYSYVGELPPGSEGWTPVGRVPRFSTSKEAAMKVVLHMATKPKRAQELFFSGLTGFTATEPLGDRTPPDVSSRIDPLQVCIKALKALEKQ